MGSLRSERLITSLPPENLIHNLLGIAETSTASAPARSPGTALWTLWIRLRQKLRQHYEHGSNADENDFDTHGKVCPLTTSWSIHFLL